MKKLEFEQVTHEVFTKLLPESIMLKQNDDVIFDTLVNEGDEIVNAMIEKLCGKKRVKVPYKGMGFSVDSAQEESLDLWMLRIHNEILQCATIRNFYILFQIEDGQAVRRECYMSFQCCEELLCGWFIQEGQLVLFKNEFFDEDDETDAIVNHYRKKYQINSEGEKR